MQISFVRVSGVSAPAAGMLAALKFQDWTGEAPRVGDILHVPDSSGAVEVRGILRRAPGEEIVCFVGALSPSNSQMVTAYYGV